MLQACSNKQRLSYERARTKKHTLSLSLSLSLSLCLSLSLYVSLYMHSTFYIASFIFRVYIQMFHIESVMFLGAYSNGSGALA